MQWRSCPYQVYTVEEDGISVYKRTEKWTKEWWEVRKILKDEGIEIEWGDYFELYNNSIRWNFFLIELDGESFSNEVTLGLRPDEYKRRVLGSPRQSFISSQRN